MDRNRYQSAFSWLAPSQTAVGKALAAAERPQPKRRAHLGTVLAAAALSVVLLTGFVLAATQLHWFNLGSADQLVEPAGKEDVLPGAPAQPAAQSMLTFDVTPGDTYAGFLLPASYRSGIDAKNSWMLADRLRTLGVLEQATLDGGTMADTFLRYYRNPDPSDPHSPLLTIQILSTDGYYGTLTRFTRFTTTQVKSDTLNGMKTVWILVEDSYAGTPQYLLFQHNETLGCVAMICSTVGFEEAEQAALDMRYVDSGAPVLPNPACDIVWYGMQLPALPEGMTLTDPFAYSNYWWAVNATLQDPSQDLDSILLSAMVRRGNSRNYISVRVQGDADGFLDTAPIETGTLIKTGTLCGQAARWIQTAEGGVIIQVYFPQEHVLLEAMLAQENVDGYTVEDVERVLESVELIAIPVAAPAPNELTPFSVG